ncbi:MAG: phosphoglycerate kinase [Saprospiraceae bacterium]|nr:phosphoglycerate kinase [Saprospiraceae bacterium]
MKPATPPDWQICAKNLQSSKAIIVKNLNVKDQYVLLRVDFNVPIKDGIIQDDTRIVKSLDTIRYLLDQKAKVIVMSHLGRPLKELTADGQLDVQKFSLKPIAEKLEALLQTQVLFASDCGGPDSLSKRSQLLSGGILLLENTRFHKGEEKGDPQLAQQLAVLGDFFINDALGAAHREHASTATIARYFDKDHKAFGLLMQSEVENGQRVLKNPHKPCTAIIGGAKVSDKILLISNLMEFCDSILIGGGMAYTFLNAQGFEIGNSLCEKDKLELALELIALAKAKNVQLLLPNDSVVAKNFEDSTATLITDHPAIPLEHMGLDIGPKTIERYTSVILKSKTILWNGPMGVFEKAAFSNGTKDVALAIAAATTKGAYSLVGGGDSVSAIKKFKLGDQVSFVSTGGGAMLEMLEGKVLPGIEAILN